MTKSICLIMLLVLIHKLRKNESMNKQEKLSHPWNYRYDELIDGLYFHGHSSVWINEGKPEIKIYAEQSLPLVLKRASWGSGRIILINAFDLDQKEDGEASAEETDAYTKSFLQSHDEQEAHNKLAGLGHNELIEGKRSIIQLSHKKLKQLESNKQAVHVPLLENKSSFFNNVGLTTPSLQAWHFFEVVRAFINGANIPVDVLKEYVDLLSALEQSQKNKDSHGILQLPCVVGGGLAKPSYYTSVNTDLLSRITGSYKVNSGVFLPDNEKAHGAQLRGMPRDFFIWLNATIIGNENEPVVIADLLGAWESALMV